MDTVRASGQHAHGHIASGFSPLLWKTLRKESQEVSDPEMMGKQENIEIHSIIYTIDFTCNDRKMLDLVFIPFVIDKKKLLRFLHGLAPSATSSKRREASVMSL